MAGWSNNCRRQKAFQDAADLLEDAREEILASPASQPFPKASLEANLVEQSAGAAQQGRFAGAADVVGIFPDRAAIIRVVGAVLLNKMTNGPYPVRYISLESLQQLRSKEAVGQLTAA